MTRSGTVGANVLDDASGRDHTRVGPIRHHDLASTHRPERFRDRSRRAAVGQPASVLDRGQQHVDDRHDAPCPRTCVVVVCPQRGPMVRVVDDRATALMHRGRIGEEPPPPRVVQHRHGDAAEAHRVNDGCIGMEIVVVQRSAERAAAPLVRERALAGRIDGHAIPAELGPGHASDPRDVDALISTEREQRVAVRIVAHSGREDHVEPGVLAFQVDGEVQRVAPEPPSRRSRRILQQLDERLADDQDERHGRALVSREAERARSAIRPQEPSRISPGGQTQLPPTAKTCSRAR